MDGAVCTMAAESDIVIINTTRNNDLSVIDSGARYSGI